MMSNSYLQKICIVNAFTISFCAVVALSAYAQPHKAPLNIQSSKPKERTFKVQSLPFDINGLHLQFQYIVKEDANAEKEDYLTGEPVQKILILDKKLVDLKRHMVVLNFPMEPEDIRSNINLSKIDKAKYTPEYFEDANFDGYKDIREPCVPCSGSMGNFETIYLFNPRTRKFDEWPYGTLINVEIHKENKTVQSFAARLSDGGQFHYQEIKFNGQGVQLYEKNIDCFFLNEKKRTFKVVYDKYVGKKLVIHKTRILTDKENVDPHTTMAKMEK